MTVYQCRCNNYRNINVSDFKRACGEFNCEFKKSIHHCNCDCDGPLEITTEQLIEQAKDNIVYDNIECNSVTVNDIAICPYCGIEIDMLYDRHNLENIDDIVVLKCPVCGNNVKIELVDITYRYKSYLTD